MKKLKIVQPGYEDFTGFINGVQFVNGVSVESASAADITHALSAIDIE